MLEAVLEAVYPIKQHIASYVSALACLITTTNINTMLSYRLTHLISDSFNILQRHSALSIDITGMGLYLVVIDAWLTGA